MSSNQSRTVVVWDDLQTVERATSIELAMTSPVQAKHSVKQKILEAARTDYLKFNRPVVHNRTASLWGMVKTQLQAQPRSNWLQPKPFPTLISHSDYYDYSLSDDKSVWVVFANSKLGGGYLNSGWVQEEIITAEFYEMTLGLNQLTQTHQRTLSRTEVALWFNLVQNSEHVSAKYGGNNIRRAKVSPSIDREFLQPIPSGKMVQANFLSMDAVNRSARDQPYTLDELQHLFIKALAGFESSIGYGLTKVHSGNWGAGAFHNQFHIILMIQVLAAWMSGLTEFHYWGTKDVHEAWFDHVWTVFETVSTTTNANTNDPWTLAEVYAHLANELGLPFSLDQLLTPITSSPLIELEQWSWQTDDREWMPYPEDIQRQLKEVTSQADSAQFMIGSTRYQMVYRPGRGWRQIQVANPTKTRSVLAPKNLQ